MPGAVIEAEARARLQELDAELQQAQRALQAERTALVMDVFRELQAETEKLNSHTVWRLDGGRSKRAAERNAGRDGQERAGRHDPKGKEEKFNEEVDRLIEATLESTQAGADGSGRTGGRDGGTRRRRRRRSTGRHVADARDQAPVGWRPRSEIEGSVDRVIAEDGRTVRGEVGGRSSGPVGRPMGEMGEGSSPMEVRAYTDTGRGHSRDRPVAQPPPAGEGVEPSKGLSGLDAGPPSSGSSVGEGALRRVPGPYLLGEAPDADGGPAGRGWPEGR